MVVANFVSRFMLVIHFTDFIRIYVVWLVQCISDMHCNSLEVTKEGEKMNHCFKLGREMRIASANKTSHMYLRNVKILFILPTSSSLF